VFSGGEKKGILLMDEMGKGTGQVRRESPLFFLARFPKEKRMLAMSAVPVLFPIHVVTEDST
jgi:hypothetical protein